jgi:hypothetical protein
MNLIMARHRPPDVTAREPASNGPILATMARFVYIDETGTGGRQPYLYVVAAVVDEGQVQPLAREMRRVAQHHLGWLPLDFEFHGRHIWGGTDHWTGKTPPELIAAYADAIEILNTCDIDIAYASIDKAALHVRHNGAADANAYRLALQFLLEKIDANLGATRKVLVADEAHEQELDAIKMVADMQQWGTGEVPSRPLATIIDSLHFVRSHASPGVQMADLTAYVIQRRRMTPTELHPDAEAAMARMRMLVADHTRTWRETWP